LRTEEIGFGSLDQAPLLRDAILLFIDNLPQQLFRLIPPAPEPIPSANQALFHAGGTKYQHARYQR
jgi:hypothetical protein